MNTQPNDSYNFSWKTTFEALRQINPCLPVLAAPFIFNNGDDAKALIGVEPAPGVNERNVEWMRTSMRMDEKYAIYAALGMAFWRYDQSMRFFLLEKLPDFDPFTVSEIGGFPISETVETLFAIAKLRPLQFIRHWRKFKDLGDRSETMEDVEKNQFGMKRNTALTIEVRDLILGRNPSILLATKIVPNVDLSY